MSDPFIVCPYCNKEIQLNEAVSHQIRDELEREFKKEVMIKEQELIEKFSKEQEQIELKAKEKAEAKIALDFRDLQQQITEEQTKRKEAETAELSLRKKIRDVEEKEKNLELDLQRKFDAEKQKIEEAVTNRITDQQRLKDLETEKINADLRRQIDDLKRKAEQGSQQLQGEILELELEKILKDYFPTDTIQPVPKGKKGADVIQKVHNSSGNYCGTIIWESKRAKKWGPDWIPKLKSDRKEVKADIAVIYSTVFPKNITSFGFTEGIWVTDHKSLFGLATALRLNIIQVMSIKQSSISKDKKMEKLYNYLSGSEFHQKVECIVEAVFSMQQDLINEKASMQRIWDKRAQNISNVFCNTAGIWGDFQGIGASLPQMKVLELGATTENQKLLPPNDSGQTKIIE